MPLYQYECETCGPFEAVAPVARCREPARCGCGGDGRRVFAAPGGHPPACWPKESIALSVHRTQAKEANEHAAVHGCATRYKDDGTAVVPSRADQKKLVKARGYFNRSGSYGD